MNTDKRNLVLAVIASLAIMLGFHFFYEKPRLEKAIQEQQKVDPSVSSTVPSIQDAPSPKVTVQTSLDDALKGPRIKIESSSLKGLINLQGARIDYLVLKNYKQKPEEDSDSVVLLQPQDTKQAYYAEAGWVSTQPGLTLPGRDTMWTALTQNDLTPQTPLLLTWTNPEGVIFEREITVDDQYMFQITDRIKNASAQPLTVSFYSLINRSNPDVATTTYALHEGMVGYLTGKLKETKFKDMEDTPKETFQTNGGWLGITDSKYWLTALIPNPQETTASSFRFIGTPENPRFQTDCLSPQYTVAPGSQVEEKFHLFAGPKSVEILDAYESTLSIPHFDLAVDFGWFYFITKPLFFVLKWLYGLCHNLGIAIILLTLMIRLAMFPLANKSFKSMAKMKELQPELNRLKEAAGQDKMKLNQDMMLLYKKHKVNPVSGCLPMILQIPVFFAIYKVLLISIEMRQAPFFWWIQDLSAPDPTSLFNLFGLISWTPPGFLMIGALPLVMGLTMFWQQKSSPQPMDPMQAKMFLVMPIIFTYLFAQFPAGLVLYWTCTNIFSIGQQWLITSVMPSFQNKQS